MLLRITLILTFFLSLTGISYASQQVMAGSIGISALTAGTYYLTPFGEQTITATEERAYCFTPSAVTFKKLKVALSVAPGAGNSYIFTLRKNGADQAVTCTISGTATSCQDDTNSFSSSGGLPVVLKVSSTGTPASGALYHTTVVEGAKGESMLCGSTYDTNISNAATSYFPLSGSKSGGALVEANVHMIVPFYGTIKNLWANASAAAGAGNNYVITIRKNAGDTTLTCTIGETDPNCNDVTNSFTVVPGDRINFEVTPNSLPTAALMRGGVSVISDIPGLFIFPLSSSINMSGTVQEFCGISTGACSWSSTELKQLAQSMKILKLMARVTAGVAGLRAHQFDLMLNSVASGLTCTVTGGVLTCQHIKDIVIQDNDFLSTSQTPLNSPLAGMATISYMGYIAEEPRLINYGQLIINSQFILP